VNRMQIITSKDVYIVGHHPFLAHHLLQILRRDGQGEASWMGDTISPKSRVGQRPLFLLDKWGLDFSVAQYIRTFNSRFDDPRFIVLDERLDIYAVCQFLSWGAHGFLTYDQIPDSLTPAIHSVQDGNTWFDYRVLQKYTRNGQRERRWQSTTPEEESLTLREQDILSLVRQRLLNKEIASLLGIEVSTVKFHLSNIFSKLQIASRSDLWRVGSPQTAPCPEEEAGPRQMVRRNQESGHNALYERTGS